MSNVICVLANCDVRSRVGAPSPALAYRAFPGEIHIESFVNGILAKHKKHASDERGQIGTVTLVPVDSSSILIPVKTSDCNARFHASGHVISIS